MLIKLLLVVALIYGLDGRGFTATEKSQFMNGINRMRNQVATGSLQAWAPAANMNALAWSTALATRASSCAAKYPSNSAGCAAVYTII
jgi:hypothetical protein